MKLTGGQIVAEGLAGAGLGFVSGIPGHGCLALVDALHGSRDRLPVYIVRHEQSAVHLADGYYRASGRPAAAFTSIGPGALNTAVGLGTAFVDSTAVLVLAGETHTHMTGRGVLQELERVRPADSIRVLEPLAKYAQAVGRVEQLPHALGRALRAMVTGRPGPAILTLPMDVQADQCDVDSAWVGAGGGNLAVDAGHGGLRAARPDPQAVERAASLLNAAGRSVILAGGGVLRAGPKAAADLVRLAERLGAAVITTLAGKSSFPEDHPLYAWHAGSKGTAVGNELASTADVLLAIGCRFADETASSYRPGASFSIGPTKLIHADVDPAEIGKNYPAEVGLVGDAAWVAEDLLAALGPGPDLRDRPYVAEIGRRRAAWLASLEPARSAGHYPVTVSRALSELRAALPRNGYVVTSSGHSQAQILQEFPFYEPGTLVTTGGFSTMGFALPAALGVRLARPAAPVVAVAGDGDFLMTAQELATAVQYGLGVVILVLNNDGFLSIRDLQADVYGPDRACFTEFGAAAGQGRGGPGGAREPGRMSVDFAALARSFGVTAETVSRAGEVGPAVSRALGTAASTGRPAMVEVIVNRDYGLSGGRATGWWDVPVPAYLEERRGLYERARVRQV